MKKIYPEFFVNKKRIDFNDLDDSILVVLDANILLELYRSSSKLRDELTESINMVKSNLWMPYQVGFEFNRNRKILMHKIANDKSTFEKKLNSNINNTLDEYIEEFKKKYKLFEEIVEENKSKINDLKFEVEKTIKLIGNEINSNQQSDFLELIETIYVDKIADNSSYNYQTWVEEAEVRYKINQPPGYKDYNNKKDKHYFIKGKSVSAAYGDFFMWKEMLLKAKEDHIKEVVFITNDVKEDWFFETTGKKVGARVELIEEMIRESNANFRIFTSSSFLFSTLSQEKYLNIESEVKSSEILETNNDFNDNKYKIGSNNKIRFENSFSNKDLFFDNSSVGKIHEMMANFEKFMTECMTAIIDLKSNDINNSTNTMIDNLYSEFKSLVIQYDNFRYMIRQKKELFSDTNVQTMKNLLTDIEYLTFRVKYLT